MDKNLYRHSSTWGGCSEGLDAFRFFLNRTSYVLSFRMVFFYLLCDHELDFFHRLNICENSINQSIQSINQTAIDVSSANPARSPVVRRLTFPPFTGRIIMLTRFRRCVQTILWTPGQISTRLSLTDLSGNNEQADARGTVELVSRDQIMILRRERQKGKKNMFPVLQLWPRVVADYFIRFTHHTPL